MRIYREETAMNISWTIISNIYGGPKVRWPKSVTAISTSFTAISISPRQFQLRSRQFQFHHGNFNFVHGNFNFTTAISISSRQFQFHLLSPHFPFPLPRSQGLYGHLRWMTWRKNLKYKFQSLRIICLPQNAKHSRT